MDLSIITVSWNVKNKLRKNLGALFRCGNKIDFEVFVVDNNSADGSAKMVEKEFPQAKLIANQKNLGFARANNQAIKKAQGRYILLLNPDMRVLPDTLDKMVVWMDRNEKAGVAGCYLINQVGATVPQVRNFPTFWDQLAIILKIPHLFSKVLDNYLKRDFDYGKEAEVDSIRGSFFMIS